MTKAPRPQQPETGATPADKHGLWGRGRHGGGFQRREQREYSREDYGATDRGPGMESPPGAEDIDAEQTDQKRSTSSSPGPRGRSSQPVVGAPGKAAR